MKNLNEAYVYVPVSNIDDTGVLSDDELYDFLRKLEVYRDSLVLTRQHTFETEEKLCFLQREAQLRHTRRRLHEQYLKDQDAEFEDIKKLEATYPVADLDNSRFLTIERYRHQN